MEVGIASADSADSVLSHRHGSMQVVEEVAAHIRQLPQGLRQDRGVTGCRRQQLKPGRYHQGFQKSPGFARRPRRYRGAWVGGDPEELVADAPGQKGGRRVLARLQQPGAAAFVERRIPVDRVDQDIRVEDQGSVPVQDPVEFFSVGNVDPEAAASPGRKWRQGIRGAIAGIRYGKDAPKPRLDQGGHGGSAPRRFHAQPSHYGLVDIQGGLHMENHITCILVCKLSRAGRPIFAGRL